MAVTKIPTFRPTEKPAEDPKAMLRKAAEQYEQFFLGEMVKAMRNTIDKAPTEDSSFARDYYTQQLDQQYVEKWGDRGGIGLANLIYDQISERFFGTEKPLRPQGPLPVQKGTTIKIDETRPMGVPINTPAGAVSDEVSFLYEWEKSNAEDRDVRTPWDGEVQKAFKVGDNRQVIKIQHDNGLVSTLSFLGDGSIKMNDKLSSGDVLGKLATDARGLTWQLAKVGPV